MKLFQKILTIAIIATTTVFALISCKEKDFDSEQLSAFRIYDYRTFPEGKNTHTFSEDDIHQMNFIEPNLDEAKSILKKAKPLGRKSYLWKGHHFATMTFSNGKTRRIKVSTYGGFFLDLTTNRYYEFKDDARTEWEKFWSKYYNLLHKNET